MSDMNGVSKVGTGLLTDGENSRTEFVSVTSPIYNLGNRTWQSHGPLPDGYKLRL